MGGGKWALWPLVDPLCTRDYWDRLQHRRGQLTENKGRGREGVTDEWMGKDCARVSRACAGFIIIVTTKQRRGHVRSLFALGARRRYFIQYLSLDVGQKFLHLRRSFTSPSTNASRRAAPRGPRRRRRIQRADTRAGATRGFLLLQVRNAAEFPLLPAAAGPAWDTRPEFRCCAARKRRSGGQRSRQLTIAAQISLRRELLDWTCFCCCCCCCLLTVAAGFRRGKRRRRVGLSVPELRVHGPCAHATFLMTACLPAWARLRGLQLNARSRDRLARAPTGQLSSDVNAFQPAAARRSREERMSEEGGYVTGYFVFQSRDKHEIRKVECQRTELRLPPARACGRACICVCLSIYLHLHYIL